jgi:hypothetical protein
MATKASINVESVLKVYFLPHFRKPQKLQTLKGILASGVFNIQTYHWDDLKDFNILS